MSYNREVFEMLAFHMVEAGYEANITMANAPFNSWGLRVYLKPAHGFYHHVDFAIHKNEIYCSSQPILAPPPPNNPIGRLEDPDVLGKLVKFCEFFQERVDNGETA